MKETPKAPVSPPDVVLEGNEEEAVIIGESVGGLMENKEEVEADRGTAEKESHKEGKSSAIEAPMVLGEASSWLLVSPAKVGRPSGPQQEEDIHISASKFTVLSLDEEEEGEIMDKETQVTEAAANSNLSNCENAEEEPNGRNGEESFHLGADQTMEDKRLGDKKALNKPKEKKAKSQDANPSAMSTRSSRRQQ